MLTNKQLLHSRTFWSILATFLISGYQATAPQIAQMNPKLGLVLTAVGTGASMLFRKYAVQGTKKKKKKI